MRLRPLTPSLPPFALAVVALALIPGSADAQTDAENLRFAPVEYEALEYRMIGPYRGGRVTAVTGIADDPYTYYMGSTGGGVWKTGDGGDTWANVSDGFFDAGSVGAIDVADSDRNVVYAGTGSACTRGNVSTGIGVYRSTDAGATWEFAGLPEAGQIGAVQVHPEDPDRVYVAALGQIFGKNEERGVYRSEDGGDSWERVLFASDSVGAVDLAMNPENPRVIYAAMWRAERKPWTMISGCSAECANGIWKTTDGGDTWTKLGEGLPEGPTGRIGVSVSGDNPDRVYAIVEALRGEHGLYRSDDAGATWRQINTNEDLVARSWYYNHVTADPLDENTVYVVSDEFWKSNDGGETFFEVHTPHGDNHDLWINPNDNRIMIEGNDGGANVTYNEARTWSAQTNQPTAEFYSVTVDDAFPYRVYGPQQDNSTISVPSRVKGEAITIQDWLTVGGCETGPIEVDPGQDGVFYSGCYGGRLYRFDLASERERAITPYPIAQLGIEARDLEYRFQWNSPILASRHHPDVLYYASQVVHRSTDEGQTWEVVSPDLTDPDTATMGKAGEPITRDMTGVEIYPSIFSLVEDDHDPDLLWAGTNDGNIHVSRDRGETWTEVTPEGMPEFSTVSVIEPSPHRAGRAFAAVYRYRMDDWTPRIYRTDDHGASWTRIADGTTGIPPDHPTRAVREDPDREGLLYAGTEFGLFVSFDDGAHWQSLQLNLPRTPVTDLEVHRQDLVVATQGRSFWILDDVTPLHQLTDRVAEADVHLYEPRAAYRTEYEATDEDETYPGGELGGARLERSRTASNPPYGAFIHYKLAADADGATLEILDPAGDVVRTFSADREGDGHLPGRAGMHRFVWDLTYPGVDGGGGGPEAVPGTYRARLTALGETRTRSFEVRMDPRYPVSVADLRARFDLAVDVRDSMRELADAVDAIESVREQVEDLETRTGGRSGASTIADRGRALLDAMAAVEAELVRQPEGRKMGYTVPKLRRQLAAVASAVASTHARPTRAAVDRYRELEERLGERLDALEGVWSDELAAFNRAVESAGVNPVVVPGG